ncbi:unnamed protein product [Gadus morhua 'NCC']
MFRIAVETGLCTKIREGLKTVIGLGRMNAMDWEEAITHHVNLEQDREDEDVKEERDLKKRLLRMDVKKATQEHNRDKKELNKDHASEIMPLEVAPPPAPPPTPNPLVQPSGPPPTQVQAPPAQAGGPQPPPYPNPYPYPYPPSYPATQMGPGMYQNQQFRQRGGSRWRGRGRTPNTNPTRSYPCFICGLIGHWAKDCPQPTPPGMQHDQHDHQPQPSPPYGNPGNGSTHASNPGTPMYPLWRDPGYDSQY